MLVLLADTRKKLLWLWLGFTAGLVLLFFVQTIAGKYEDIEAQAWTWLFVQLLPGVLLLWAAVLLNKNPSKVLMRATFRAVYAAALAYLLLVVLSLLALPAATANWSIEGYFAQSYTWLVPFQIVLLLLFGWMYFRKEMLFRPNAAILQQYVEKKAEFARRGGSSVQMQAFERLISEEGLAGALDFLRSQQPGNNDLLVLQNQLAGWKNQADLNLSSQDVLQRELNRMTLAAISIIEKL
ncbi:MAG: hypothetical protein IT260_00185 [Saprospiraceae bacterium]|nr:hypothetical protein [Saprospiraceae bacterium]